jgi:hypothetical protein
MGFFKLIIEIYFKRFPDKRKHCAGNGNLATTRQIFHILKQNFYTQKASAKIPQKPKRIAKMHKKKKELQNRE